MPTLRYALEPGGARRLEITYRLGFKDLVAKLDGLEVGRVVEADDLKQGRDFLLTDGSLLSIQYVRTLHRADLVVLRNGKPLPGSSTHPGTAVKTAAGFLAFIAVVNIVFGVFNVGGTGGFGADAIGMIVEGLIYAVLAWRVLKRSLIALVIAIVLYAADAVYMLMNITEGGGQGAHGIVLRVVVFIALFRGFAAIRALKAESERGALPSPV